MTLPEIGLATTAALIVFGLKSGRDVLVRRRREALHRASFRPSMTILCHNNPAEAGSSRTPAALSRSQ